MAWCEQVRYNERELEGLHGMGMEAKEVVWGVLVFLTCQAYRTVFPSALALLLAFLFRITSSGVKGSSWVEWGGSRIPYFLQGLLVLRSSLPNSKSWIGSGLYGSVFIITTFADP